MKHLIFLPIFLFCGLLYSQNLDGSWKLIQQNGESVTDKEVMRIHQDGYFAFGSKEIGTNKFLSAAGGEFTVTGTQYAEIKDFDTENIESLGETREYEINWEDDNTVVISDGSIIRKWKRLQGTTNDLTKTWVITGRERKGVMSTMVPGDRRTVKILSGGRFQWIAFNSATGEFSGTGGGSYTAVDGKYTEKIEFFSRDDSRVNASLQFQYEVKDGKWHHKGTSSKGDPIYEIWSPYEEAYKKG